ncbi:MAG: hypothetical protein PHE84_12035 [bacterium]|nr:hypothetical protein [bacterium]
MGRKPLIIAAVCGFLLVGTQVFSGSGCGRAGQTDLSEVASLLNEGKTRLGQADYVGARAHFSRILDDYDSTNSQANLGLVLSDLLGLADQILQVQTLTASSGRGGLLPTADQPGNQMVYEAVREIMENYRARFLLLSARLQMIAADPRFSFRIDSAPVYYGEQKVLDLGGDYDLGDILVLDAVVSSALGGMEQLLSVNFLADYLGLEDFASRYLSDELVNGKSDFSLLTGLLVYLLKDSNYPEFLDFTPDGRERMIRAGRWYGQASGDLLAALNWIEKREGTFPSHLVYYRDDNGDRKYAQDEPLIFPELQIPQGASFQLQIKLTPEAVQGIKAVDESFGSPAKRVSLSRHIFPIAEMLLSGAGESLGISPGLVRDIWQGLTGVAGDHLELELGHYFLEPVSSRSLLPAWNTGTGRNRVFLAGGEFSLELFRTANRFLLEWDACEYPDAASDFVCSREAAADRGHFSETDLFPNFSGVNAIPADGIISPAPYFPFPDPSFNRLFWVNLSGIPGLQETGAAETGFHPADLYEINALLAYYSSFFLTWVENIIPAE